MNYDIFRATENQSINQNNLSTKSLNLSCLEIFLEILIDS